MVHCYEYKFQGIYTAYILLYSLSKIIIASYIPGMSTWRAADLHFVLK